MYTTETSVELEILSYRTGYISDQNSNHSSRIYNSSFTLDNEHCVKITALKMF